MSHIFTLTFSPCIDKSASIPKLIPEKKLRCSMARLDPGGGGINVARAIRNLGGEATAVYPAGGYTGNSLNTLLKEEKIPVIVIESRNETRENVIILEKEKNHQFRFGFPGTELKEDEWKACIEAIESASDLDFIVASGSLPPGVPEDVYAGLAKIAKKKNARLVVDTSGEALKHAVKEGVYLLKPNLGELSTLAGKEHLEEEEVEDVARKVISNGGCEVIVVSMAEKGALLVSQGETHVVKPPEVQIKSTVGAGDSMVAGIVLALHQGKSLKDALHFGVASGTATTMKPGTELCDLEGVKEVLASMHYH